MYVCKYLYIHEQTKICRESGGFCIHVHMIYTCIYVYISIRMCRYIRIKWYSYIHKMVYYVCVDIYVYVHIRICVYICMCRYTYMYIYMVFIYTYMYVYMNTFLCIFMYI